MSVEMGPFFNVGDLVRYNSHSNPQIVGIVTGKRHLPPTYKVCWTVSVGITTRWLPAERLVLLNPVEGNKYYDI